MCSIVPDSSLNCPSIDVIRVLSVETDPVDLSSEVEVGFAECVIECGTGKGDLSGGRRASSCHQLTHKNRDRLKVENGQPRHQGTDPLRTTS